MTRNQIPFAQPNGKGYTPGGQGAHFCFPSPSPPLSRHQAGAYNAEMLAELNWINSMELLQLQDKKANSCFI